MKPRWSALAAMWMVSLGVATSASAVPTYVFFSGEVTSVGTSGRAPFPTVGTHLLGSLGLDPETVTGGAGSFSFTGVLHLEGGSPVTAVDYPIGVQQFPGYLEIQNTSLGDAWQLVTDGSCFCAFIYADLRLFDSTGTALDSTDFVLPSSLEGWSSATIDLVVNQRGPPILAETITLTQWAVAPVPEPGILALVATAVALLVTRTGRRSTLRCRPRAPASSMAARRA